MQRTGDTVCPQSKQFFHQSYPFETVTQKTANAPELRFNMPMLPFMNLYAKLLLSAYRNKIILINIIY